MATILQQYEEKRKQIYQKIAEGDLPLQEVLTMQELNYRICVLDTFQSLCRMAPVTTAARSMGFHFQMLDAYIRFLPLERRFGPKADEAGQKKRETALKSLERVAEDGRKRFMSFHAETPEQYKETARQYVNTVLPVWLQYRNTYITI